MDIGKPQKRITVTPKEIPIPTTLPAIPVVAPTPTLVPA